MFRRTGRFLFFFSLPALNLQVNKTLQICIEFRNVKSPVLAIGFDTRNCTQQELVVRSFKTNKTNTSNLLT